MQPFRLRKEALTWFKDLFDRNEFKINFDAFYFCFMAGIAEGRKATATAEEAPELVDYFPEGYNHHRAKTMVALFLTKELEQLGVKMEEKRSVHSAIAALVSPETLTHLSDDGMREFNKYAHGGFEVLSEWFDDRPRSLETFLRAFKRQLDGRMNAEGLT
jgi:hypothetical protein